MPEEQKAEKKQSWGEWFSDWVAAGRTLANTALGKENYQKFGTGTAVVGAVEVGKGIVEGDFGEIFWGSLMTAGGIGLRIFGHHLFTGPATVPPPIVEPMKPEDEAAVAHELGISAKVLGDYKNLLDAKASELAKKVKVDYCDLLAKAAEGRLNSKDRIRLDLLQKLAAMEINAAKEAVVGDKK